MSFTPRPTTYMFCAAERDGVTSNGRNEHEQDGSRAAGEGDTPLREVLILTSSEPCGGAGSVLAYFSKAPCCARVRGCKEVGRKGIYKGVVARTKIAPDLHHV